MPFKVIWIKLNSLGKIWTSSIDKADVRAFVFRVVTSTYMIICLPSNAMKNEFLLPKIKVNRKLITKYSREMGKVYVRKFLCWNNSKENKLFNARWFRQIYFRFMHDDISTINVAVERNILWLFQWFNCWIEEGEIIIVVYSEIYIWLVFMRYLWISIFATLSEK